MNRSSRLQQRCSPSCLPADMPARRATTAPRRRRHARRTSPRRRPPRRRPFRAPSAAIPVGQEMDVRLSTSLSSETATVEQRFEATTVVDLIQDGRCPRAGAVVQGVVVDVDKAGRVDRDGALTLAFDRIRVRGRELRDARDGDPGVREQGDSRRGRHRWRGRGRWRHRRRHHRWCEGRDPRSGDRRRRRDRGHRRQGHLASRGSIVRIRMDTPVRVA